MDIHQLANAVTDGLHGVTSSTGVDITTLAVGALIAGILGAVAPKNLRIVPLAYIGSGALLVYMHQMQYLHLLMAAGAITAVVLYPFRAKKTA